MNIFAVSPDPREAAIMLCDKHIVKMPVESGQMLCAAFLRHTPNMFDNIYSVTKAQAHHPCSLWAGDTRSNFVWLIDHAEAMLSEYDYVRFGKDGTYSRLRTILARCRRFADVIPDGLLTPFVQAMPEKYKIAGSAESAYRQFYIGEKARFAKWTNRSPPDWWPHA